MSFSVLFNKDTFFPDVKVTSIYLHNNRKDLPDKVREGESGSVIQGVLSRVFFFGDNLPAAKKSFTVISVHIHNNCAKKRGIGKKLLLTFRAMMLDEMVDLVAGDFSGAAWRRTTCASTLSIIGGTFADCDLLLPPGTTPL